MSFVASTEKKKTLVSPKPLLLTYSCIEFSKNIIVAMT